MTNKTRDKIVVLCVILNFGIAMFNVTWKRPKPPKTVTQEIAELANNWRPDWGNPHQEKFYVYDGPEGPAVGMSNVRRIYGVSYFETASQAGEAMLYLSDKLGERE